VNELAGGVALGRAGRVDDEQGGVRGFVEAGSAYVGDAAHGTQSLREPVERGGRLGPRQIGRDEQRPVPAGPEALADQVVGLTGGGPGGVVALVGEAEAQAGRGGGEDEQDGRAGDRHRPGPVLDRPAPARRGRRAAAAARRATATREVEPIYPGAEEGEQRRQQRDRRGHHDEHGQGGRDGDAAQRRDADHEQAEDRDHHGRAGDEHAPPGGLHRLHHSRTPLGAAAERAAKAGQEQQGVVDPDPDAEQRRDRGRPVRRVDHRRDDADQRRRDP
jgi:hypothetical protein